MISIDYPLVWSQAVVDKIWQKHHVTPEEVEEAVFDDRPIGLRGIARSYCIYGQSIAGRYLFIVVGRTRKAGQYKVVTTREMKAKERRYYRKHRA